MTNQRKLDAYRQDNLEASRIVLEDVDKFGGPESLMVMWAEAVQNPERSMVDRLKVRAGLPKEAA